MKQLLQTEIIISLVTLYILGQNNNSCTCFVLTSNRRSIQSSAYKVLKTEKCMVDQQEQQHQQGIEEHQKDRNKSDDGDEGTPSTSLVSSLNDDTNAPLSMPLAGGPSLIFAMARRMLIWDESSTLNSTTSKDNSSIDNNEVKQEHELRTLLDSNEAKKHLNVSINAVIVAHYHDGIRMVEYQIVIHRLDQHRQK